MERTPVKEHSSLSRGSWACCFTGCGLQAQSTIRCSDVVRLSSSPQRSGSLTMSVGAFEMGGEQRPSSGDCDVWLGPKVEAAEEWAAPALSSNPSVHRVTTDGSTRMRMEAGSKVLASHHPRARKIETLCSPTGSPCDPAWPLVASGEVPEPCSDARVRLRRARATPLRLPRGSGNPTSRRAAPAGFKEDCEQIT